MGRAQALGAACRCEWKALYRLEGLVPDDEGMQLVNLLLLKRSMAVCRSRLLTLPSMRSTGYLRRRRLSSSTSIMILN